MKLRIIGALTIALCVCWKCDAQSVRIKLMNCNLDKETLAKIQNSLNYQLGFYATIFNQPIDTSFRARVFGSEKEFLNYAKSEANINPRKTHSVGFYSPKLNEMVLHQQVKDFPKVFAHEVSHAILSYYCQDAPTWLDEGLAVYLEDVVANDSVFYVASSQGPKITTAKTLFLQGASVREPIDTRNFYQYPTSIRNYNLSFAVVTYLMHGRQEILANIVTSNCNQVYDSFEYYYPEGIDLLQTDVKSFFLNYNPTSD